MSRMPSAREGLGGPRLVAGTAIVVAVACAGLLGAAGVGEDGLRLVTRVTARIALVIFVAAYAAAPLRRLWRAPASAWLLRNRRFVGLSFALAQGVHGLAILALARHQGDAFEVDPVSLAGGATAYLFVALLAATSSDRAVAALGARRWRALHRAGIHAIWLVFAFTELPTATHSPLHFALAALLLAAAGLRAVAMLGARRAARTAAAA